MQKITFEDLPSTNTPINANNLNQVQDNVETALDKKLTNEVVNQTISSATFYKMGKLVIVSGWFVLNASTGSFTAPYKPITRTWAAANGVTNTASASSSNGYIDLNTNGSITITMTSAVTYCTTSFCYLTND